MKNFFNMKKLLSRKGQILILAGMLLLGLISIQNIMDKEITIKDKDKLVTIHTISSRVDSALRKADIELSEHDRLSIESGDKLEDGMTIEIYRAFPMIINVDGEDVEVLTSYNKVSQVLDQHDIELGDNDRVEPSLEEEMEANDTINVIRVKEELTRKTEEIPYKSIIKYNDSMDFNKQQRVQEGKTGEKEVEYKIVYENDQEISKEIIEENIIEEPIDEIIEKGSEKYLVASRGQVVRYKKVLTMSATAYDLSYESTGKNPGDQYYGITRSGTKARPGVVAVDPRVIPLGTKLYVESLDGTGSYGFASAEDTGGAIKGNKIDLFMESSSAVWKYGRRNVRVYVLE